MNRTAAVVALLTTVAALCAIAFGAPWSGQGQETAFLAVALVAAAGSLLVFALREHLPRGRGALILLLVLTAHVRLPLLVAPPTLSDDVHRYVLDGRLWLAGVDAYRVPPAALAAQGSASPVPRAVIARVNHPTLATIYPPGAEAFFALTQLAGAKTLGLRALFLLCDVAAVWALARMLQRRGASPWGAALFAFHPLAVLESAGSGHVDALAVAALAWTWERLEAGRPRASIAFWLIAVTVKPFAFLAAPFLVARWGLRRAVPALAVALFSYAVLAFESRSAGAASGLFTYLGHWRHNDLVYAGLLALGLVPSAAKLAGVCGLGILAALLVRARVAPVTGYAWLAAFALLMGPVLHPWYALALLAAAPVLEERGPRGTAWLLATAVLATYVVPWGAGEGAAPGFRSLPLAVRVWELAPVLVLLVFEAVRSLGSSGPSGGGAAWNERR